MDRYLETPDVDESGLRQISDLSEPLPHNLKPQDFMRMVEDLYALLHDLNTQLASKGYDRLEELLDAAGFSGLISRTVCDGVAKFSRELVVNGYPGGYPDLVPKGRYTQDRIQRGGEGLEVKASRFDTSWQSHSPRAGWFCVVQFGIDTDDGKPVRDRGATTVRAVMVSRLEESDWSWQPAGEGKKRTGTASIIPRGRSRLRANAVWVDPSYESEHQQQLIAERLGAFREQSADALLKVLTDAGQPTHWSEVAQSIAVQIQVPPAAVKSRVQSQLRALFNAGHALRTKPGTYLALSDEQSHVG